MKLAVQAEMFPVNKAKHGAVWSAGNYECRNFHGYYQCREGGEGNWCFQVPWFSNDNLTCSVYIIDEAGEMQLEDKIPIDAENRIEIRGKLYDRQHWNH